MLWTLIPTFILSSILLPSIGLIYLTLPLSNTSFTIKVIGSQWFWTYEFQDIFLKSKNNFLNSINEENILEFESYLIPSLDLSIGEYRILDVNSKLILPRNTHIRVLVTSTDVLHSWSIPSLGIKIDACPGRLNEISFIIYRNSIFYGQCSEICGVLHGFMPIVILSVSYIDFYKFIFMLKNEIDI
jgi:cytochrome c oxidase subunit 2